MLREKLGKEDQENTVLVIGAEPGKRPGFRLQRNQAAGLVVRAATGQAPPRRATHAGCGLTLVSSRYRFSRFVVCRAM
ncbi:MAG: hypothetical protein EBV46_02345 [Burkholderiaceae bacterium]|nr:hypothetical protein [Burkholderiaceae bacterium]